MQPEIATKPSVNGQPSNPIDQWDMVAFKLIQDILAPKGFKEVKNGTWRGLKIANAEQPGIVKSKVNQCQKASAQLVRSFRGRVKASIKARIVELDNWVKEDQKKFAACRFWEFKKKTELRYKIRSLFGQLGSAQQIFQELDNISIK